MTSFGWNGPPGAISPRVWERSFTPVQIELNGQIHWKHTARLRNKSPLNSNITHPFEEMYRGVFTGKARPKKGLKELLTTLALLTMGSTRTY